MLEVLQVLLMVFGISFCYLSAFLIAVSWFKK
jgi:hypothetical protein